MWVEQKLNEADIAYSKKKQELEEKTKMSGKQIGKVLTSAVLIPLAINLAMLFVMFQIFTKLATKEDPKMSKQLRSILKDGKPWKVMIMKEKGPNAFAMVRPYVFITTGLQKMLTPKEQIAVLLHEAGHITNKDVWSDIAAKNTLLSLLIAAVGTMAGPEAIVVLLMIYYYGGNAFVNVIFARTMGRFKERRADSFAVKYGYGEEMAGALKKLDKYIKKMMAKQPCGKVCKIGRKIQDAIDEHPPMKERIEKVLKEKETWKKKAFPAMRNYFLKAFGVKAK